MDRPAAIAGSFSDFKLVRTRSTAQLIIEIPIEMADEALRVLGGVPQSGKENPVAIARLKPAAVREPAPQAPEKPASGQNGDGAGKHRLSRQAALCCQDARFRKFLAERFPGYTRTDEHGGFDAELAADAVRALCGVKSRAEFDSNLDAANRWNALHAQYLAEST